MALSKAQQDQAKKWLESKVTKSGCPKCGASTFELGDIVSGNLQTKDGISIGGPSIPTLLVVCANCAHVESYAAVPIGLIK